MNQKKTNYLNNKDLLSEIHKSKLSYCEFSEPNCEDFDNIVDLPRPASKGKKVKVPHPHSEEYAAATEVRRIACLADETIEGAKVRRAARLTLKAYNQALIEALLDEKPKKNDFLVSADSIELEDLVIRFHTYEHIPIVLDKKENPSTDPEYHANVNFTPFLHYKYVIEDGEVVALREVGRSHCKDEEFNADHGNISSKLARMFVLLTDKYAQKHNWRGYTYVDDMKGNALLQLSDVGLHFNEARSENPFAYLTTTLKNAFLRVLQKEKRQQDIRDDLIEESGQTPSNTRQTNREEQIRLDRKRLMDGMDEV